MTYRNRGR